MKSTNRIERVTYNDMKTHLKTTTVKTDEDHAGAGGSVFSRHPLAYRLLLILWGMCTLPWYFELILAGTQVSARISAYDPEHLAASPVPAQAVGVIAICGLLLLLLPESWKLRLFPSPGLPGLLGRQDPMNSSANAGGMTASGQDVSATSGKRFSSVLRKQHMENEDPAGNVSPKKPGKSSNSGNLDAAVKPAGKRRFSFFHKQTGSQSGKQAGKQESALAQGAGQSDQTETGIPGFPAAEKTAGQNRPMAWPFWLGAVFFALIFALGNYNSWLFPQFWDQRTFIVWENICPFVITGFSAGWFALQGFGMITDFFAGLPCSKKPIRAGAVFWISLIGLSALFLYFLYTALYPGLWNSDSISQIAQSYTNIYSNYHPVMHTLLIKGLMNLGYAMTGTVNGAMCTYTTVQAIALAAAFAYSLMTLHQAVKRNLLWIAALLCIGASYYNWYYAVSVIKDVVFAIFILVFVTALLRLLYRLGSKRWALVMLGVGTLGICLIRNNGIPAVAVLCVLLVIFFRKSHRAAQLTMAICLVFSLILSGPVYDAAGIQPTKFTESLNIPIQQISRVVWSKHALSEEQEETIEKVILLKTVRHAYRPWLADDVKFLITTPQANYLKDHFADFRKLYMELLQEYPEEYLMAWIEQTVGYWYASYPYYRVLEPKDADSNEFSFENEIPDRKVMRWMRSVGNYENDVLILPTAIGFHTWLLLAIWLYDMSRRKPAWIACLMNLLVIGTLFIATPVFSEFRYSYFMFICMPLLWGFTLAKSPSPWKFSSHHSGKQRILFRKS